MARHAKGKKREELPDLDAPDMASQDPWRRFPRGARLAQEIERGREQEALWLLSDGALPSPALLERAMCSAAYQGMGELCAALAARGAGGRARSPAKSALRDESYGLAFEERHAPAMLALLSGHVKLASWLVARFGRGAMGDPSASALDYARVASGAALPKSLRAQGLALASEGMDAAAFARSGQALALAGSLDAALELLDRVSPLDAPKIAKAMLSPLCAYPECDPGKELALIVLERAVELCEGAQERSVAPWTPSDLEAMCVQSQYGSDSPPRGRLAWQAASRLGWGIYGQKGPASISPKVAAMMSGNAQAMEMLSGFPWTSAEVESLRFCSAMAAEAFEGKRTHASLPNMFGAGSFGKLAKGFDPKGWARAAQSMAESLDIGAVVKQGDQKRKKAVRREAKRRELSGEPAPAPMAPKRPRL